MKTGNNIRNRALVATIIAGLIFNLSCFDSNYDFDNLSDEFEITPGITIPLGYGSLNLMDIINEVDTENFVLQDPVDSLLYITYSNDLLSYKASDVVEIPDQDFIQLFIGSDIAAGAVLLVPVGDTAKFTENKNGEFVFTNNEKIDSMNLKTLKLHIDVTSSFHHLGFLLITSNNILVDGAPFSKRVQISSAAGNFSYTLDSALSEVKLILDNSDDDTTFLPLKFDLSLINSGAAVLPGEKCDINIGFRDNEFASVFGYLGEYELLVNSGRIDVSVFNETIEGGKISFADPRLALTVNNSYGIPVQIELSDVQMVSTINSSTTPITFSGVNPFDIAAPDLTQFGKSVYSEIPINKDNSNIVAAMQTEPNHLDYKATARTNAMGPTGPYNFVTDSSSMDVGIQVVLPMYLRAEGFALEDTIDFDFEDQFGENLDMIDYFRLSLDMENGLPLEATMQVYFTNASYTGLDSMFKDEEALLTPAVLGSDDKVSSTVKKVKRVEYTKEDLEKIKSAKYAMVKATVQTPATSSGFVKFYSYYMVDFKLSVKADLRINSNDL